MLVVDPPLSEVNNHDIVEYHVATDERTIIDLLEDFIIDDLEFIIWWNRHIELRKGRRRVRKIL